MAERDRGSIGTELSELSIGLLGPLEVRVDGHEVRLSAQTLQTLLLRLVVDPGAAVTADQLAEAVWGEELPANYGRTLGVHISRLRGAIGRDRVVYADGRYRLVLERATLDIAEFEDLIASGRAAREAANPAVAAHQFAGALESSVATQSPSDSTTMRYRPKEGASPSSCGHATRIRSRRGWRSEPTTRSSVISKDSLPPTPCAPEPNAFW